MVATKTGETTRKRQMMEKGKVGFKLQLDQSKKASYPTPLYADYGYCASSNLECRILKDYFLFVECTILKYFFL